MRKTLIIHPDSRCDAVTQIDVDIARPGRSALTLHYIVTGDINALRLPPVSFVRASPSGAYYEFNFAPSTQWAAYRFDGYRSGMSAVREIDAPRIDVQVNDTGFELHVALNLARLPDLSHGAPWQLGLSAVIEEKTGRKSYWALAHPPGKPDFHHSDCFALEVPTASRP
jgi:hypothetical protein